MLQAADAALRYRQHDAAIQRAKRLVQQAVAFSLVALKLRRGGPRPWRSAWVAGASGGPPGDEEATDGARRRQQFGGSPGDVRAVRSFVGRAADDAGVDREAAKVAASELATNVVRHAGTPFTVTISVRPGHLRVELSDGSAIVPAVVQMVRDDSDHGRGLRLLEALTERWGVDLQPGGKVVWFEMEPPSARQEPG